MSPRKYTPITRSVSVTREWEDPSNPGTSMKMEVLEERNEWNKNIYEKYEKVRSQQIDYREIMYWLELAEVVLWAEKKGPLSGVRVIDISDSGCNLTSRVEDGEETSQTVILNFSDVHSAVTELFTVLKLEGFPEDNPHKHYVFNGDLVDRSSTGLEVVLLVMAYKVTFPDRIHITRGNHETRIVNSTAFPTDPTQYVGHGFEDECRGRYQGPLPDRSEMSSFRKDLHSSDLISFRNDLHPDRTQGWRIFNFINDGIFERLAHAALFVHAIPRQPRGNLFRTLSEKYSKT